MSHTDLELAERLDETMRELTQDGYQYKAEALRRAAARLRAYAEAERVTMCKFKQFGTVWVQKPDDPMWDGEVVDIATFLREPTK